VGERSAPRLVLQDIRHAAEIVRRVPRRLAWCGVDDKIERDLLSLNWSKSMLSKRLLGSFEEKPDSGRVLVASA
jgi:hypothetical protein